MSSTHTLCAKHVSHTREATIEMKFFSEAFNVVDVREEDSENLLKVIPALR